MGYTFGNKLGEYIHLHYQNYMQQGLATGGKINKKNQGNVEDLSQYLDKSRKQLIGIFNNNKNQNILNQIQQNLNFLMGKGTLANGLTESDIEVVRTAIYQYMEGIFNGLQESDINWETLTINPNSKARLKNLGKNNSQAIKLSLKTLRSNILGGKDGSFYAAAFKRHLSDITIGINELAQSLPAGGMTVTSLQNRVKKLTEKANSFQGAILSQGYTSELNELRDLARDVFKLGSKAAIEGELAEAVISAAGAMIKTQGEKASNEIIKNLFIDKAFEDKIQISLD